MFDLFQWNKPVKLPHVCQKTDSHCGPAVLELLLSHQGKIVTQDEIVKAAQAKTRVIKYGTRPDQLAKAVTRLYPDLQFWFKQKTTLKDIHTLLYEHHIPVGINWQGLFYDTLEEEHADFPHPNLYGDHGHYSVIVDVNPLKDIITIADTYSDYYKVHRNFSYSWFETRWWDKDLKVDKKSGGYNLLSTNKLCFIIVSKDATYPKKIGMKLPDLLPTFKHVKTLKSRSESGQIKLHRHI